MKVEYQNSLAYKIEQKISQTKSQIILSKELAGLSDKTQISRALRHLVKKGELVKLGYGVFVKPLFYSKRLGKPIINFNEAALETLDKLKVAWELGKIMQDYNSGRSTQVPAVTSVKLKSRFSRELSYENIRLRYE